jgi:hypothetical protein
MTRTLLRELLFVVILTISVFLLVLATGCSSVTSAPYASRQPSFPRAIMSIEISV